MPKKKQIYRNKNEILEDIKKTEDFKNRMRFIKETFWPMLSETSKNVEDARMYLTSFNSILMEKFLSKMKESKFSELNLQALLDSKSEDYDKHLKFLSIFSDMSIFDVKSYLEGMRGEIDTFVTDEMKNRPLSSLKTKWVDEIKPR